VSLIVYRRFARLIASFFFISGQICVVLGQTEAASDARAVYSSVLNVIYKENRKTYSGKGHFVVLNISTTGNGPSTPSDEKYAALIRDFEKRNLTSVFLQKRLPIGVHSKTYYLVSQNEIDKLFGQGRLELERQNEAQKLATIKTVDICGSVYWTPFYEKYPEARGYYRLSRVGFSRTFAMVMVEREDVCGGFSRTYILKKTHGKWKIVTWMGTEWVA